MSDSLTTLTARIRAQLLDDGTLFSTATCTAAVRAALQQFNQAAPVHAAQLITVITDQLEYELTSADFPDLLDILDVLEYDATDEADRSVNFVKYFEDNRHWIRLKTPASTSQILVRYTQPHTVNGLDSKTESTMTADQDQVLVDGSCAAAIYIRAASRTETINLAPEVVKMYQLSADHYAAAFATGLLRYTGRPKAASELDTRAWNDIYHTWDQ
jgi:hypothetical protein